MSKLQKLAEKLQQEVDWRLKGAVSDQDVIEANVLSSFIKAIDEIEDDSR